MRSRFLPLAAKRRRSRFPRGTQTGATFRLKGMGMPDVRSATTKGDLNVTVRVEVPTKLSEDQKKLLRQFAALSGENAPIEPHHKGFFGKIKDALTGHEE